MNKYIKTKVNEIKEELYQTFRDIQFSDDEIVSAALAYYLSALRRNDHGGSVED